MYDCSINQAETDPDALLLHTQLPEKILMLGTILIILLVLMLLGAIPRWPHSRDWGYYPSGGLGLVLLILVVLLLLGKLNIG